MVQKLKSRKLWVLILSGAVTTLGVELGLSADAVQYFVGLVASYLIGQGIADAGAKGSSQGSN